MLVNQSQVEKNDRTLLWPTWITSRNLHESKLSLCSNSEDFPQTSFFTLVREYKSFMRFGRYNYKLYKNFMRCRIYDKLNPRFIFKINYLRFWNGLDKFHLPLPRAYNVYSRSKLCNWTSTNSMGTWRDQLIPNSITSSKTISLGKNALIDLSIIIFLRAHIRKRWLGFFMLHNSNCIFHVHQQDEKRNSFIDSS